MDIDGTFYNEQHLRPTSIIIKVKLHIDVVYPTQVIERNEDSTAFVAQYW